MKRFKLLLLAFAYLGTHSMHSQIDINPTLFGQNAWYWDFTITNSSTFSATFDSKISDVAASGVKYVRIGGIAENFFPLYDISGTSITGATRLQHLIDEIRNNGMEPVVQVGYNPLSGYYQNPGGTCSDNSSLNGLNQTQQATIAGNLVDYFNNPSTGQYKTNPIVYWIIANEPDLPKNCSPAKGMDLTAQTSAATIASYMREFSWHMKDKDPNILIIGPELAQFGNDNGNSGGTYYNPSNKIMDDLVNNPSNSSSIMGTITSTESTNAAGKYYVDILSFHYYPQTLSSRLDVINDPSNTQNGFYGNIRDDGTATNQWKGLAEMINNNSTGRTFSGSTAIGLACTELNLPTTLNGSNEDEGASTTNYESMIENFGLRSFLAGQWMAEVICYAMQGVTNSSGSKFGLTMVNPWSTIEGDCTNGQGYISPCTSSVQVNRPSYYHYKMVANNFNQPNQISNVYYPNLNTCASCSTHKAFCYVLLDGISYVPEIGVLIMNQDLQNPRGSDLSTKTFRINFDGLSTSSGEDMVFSFNLGLGTPYYQSTITNETTLLLKFDVNGGLQSVVVYSLQGALQGTAPMLVHNSTNNLYTQTDYDNYTGDDYADIVINDGTHAITVGSSDFKVISFINTCTINTNSSGSYTIPVGQTVTFLPTPAPH